MSENQQNLCFCVTIHKLTGYLRFTVYPQQWESYYKIYEGNFTGVVRAGRVDNENLLPGTIGINA